MDHTTASTTGYTKPSLASVMHAVASLTGIGEISRGSPCHDELFKVTVPKKKHKKTRHQTEAYHKRIQKKWNKRFGTREEWHALVINTAALGLNNEYSSGLYKMLLPSKVYDSLI